MRRLRVLVLMHEELVPPDSLEGQSEQEILKWKTEFDVVTVLREIGHEVQPLGVTDDLGKIRKAILEWKPHVAFNLLEEFHGVGVYDQHVVAYLELMRQPFTGCNPRGLMLTHDKALMKKILVFHRIPTPPFVVYPLGRRSVRMPKRLSFPLLVKSAIEDASLGISQASVVHNEEKLIERVRFVHENLGTDALAEAYIEGRELYVGVMGNQRLQTFPIWELMFSSWPEDMPRIATAKVKWDLEYQERYDIKTRRAENLSPAQHQSIARLCKRIFRVLGMSGYARMDLRLTEDGRIYVLEANANPNLEFGEDLAESAEAAGISYEQLLQRIINLGRNYRSAWKE